MNKKKDLIKNTFIILFGKLCTQLISFFLLPLYTSYLISEEYGIVDLIFTYVSLLVPVLSLQLEMAIFRYLIDARNDEEKKSKLITTNLMSLLFFIFVSIILMLIVVNLFKIKFGYYIIFIIIVNMISGNLMQVSRGLGDNVSYSISSVISGAFTVIFNVIFIVVMNLGAKGMLLAMLIANLLCSLFLFFKLKLYKYFKISRCDKVLFKNMLTYSIPLIPNGICWWVMNASDRTIINIFLGVSANGIYAVSNKFPSLLTSFFSIFNLSWSESASLTINDTDSDNYFSSVCNEVVRVFGCVGLVILAGMPFAFNILVKGDYGDSYLYIPILLVSSIFSLMASQYGSIYIAKKETKKIAITTLFAAIVNIVVHLVLVNYIGLFAAAISTAVSYFSIMIYRHFDTKKYVNISYSNTLLALLFIFYIAVIICYYLNNILLNILSLCLVMIASFIINKDFIKKFIFMIKSKISRVTS